MSHQPVTNMEDAVQGVLNAYQEYSAAGNWDAMVGMYADDERFMWVEDGNIQYRSAADIRTALSNLAATMRLQTSFQNTEVTAISESVASVVTDFNTTIQSPEGGEYSFGGIMTMTFVKEDDSWRIIRGHTSSEKERGDWE